ncbi:MAG TPA: helix-turn-helix domain-containing protein [Geminicoccaceae bacterium]|nr:helix-turn-helix domain-containing protein [Geminicoccaceae bacterium]
MAEHPDPIDVHVGQRLKLRRSLVGMSQERLADLLGITFQQIQKYERGTNRIGSSRLYQLAGILGVPVGWFFDELAVPRGGGLQEAGQGFVFDGPEPPAGAAEPNATFGRESLEMMRAFNRVADPLVRRRLYELTRALAQLRYRNSPDEPGPA